MCSFSDVRVVLGSDKSIKESEFLAKIDPIYETFQRRLLRNIEEEALVRPSDLREKLIGLTMANANDRADDFRSEVDWAERERIEFIRQEILLERVSTGELLELRGLYEQGHIDPGDTLLLEWAGVPEGG